MTKVKELLNIRINEHIEDILSVPWSHLSRENVSYWLIVCRFPTESHSNRFGICLNDSGYLFQKKNCHPFKWLGLSVRKKMSSVWTACAICSNGLGYPFEKKLSSVRTAWATHLKKIVICLNGYGYPFEKEIVDGLSDWRYLFKDKCEPSFHPKTILLLAIHVEQEWSRYKVCLQTHHEYCHGSPLLWSNLPFHIIIWLSTVSTYILFNT